MSSTSQQAAASSAHSQYAAEVARDRAAQAYENAIIGINNEKEALYRKISDENPAMSGPRDLPGVVQKDPRWIALAQRAAEAQAAHEAFLEQFAKQQEERELANKPKPGPPSQQGQVESAARFAAQQARAEEISQDIQQQRESRMADALAGGSTIQPATAQVIAKNEQVIQERNTPESKPAPIPTSVIQPKPIESYGLSGSEVTNFLHTDATKDPITGKYLGTNGVYYNSQQEAYENGAAPKPTPHYAYTIGLTENLNLGAKAAAGLGNRIPENKQVFLKEELQISNPVTTLQAQRYNTEYQNQVDQFINEAKQRGIPELIIISNGKNRVIPTSKASEEFAKAIKQDPNTIIKRPTFIGLEEEITLNQPDVFASTSQEQNRNKFLDFLEGITVPATNLAKEFISFPEGIKREIQAGSFAKAKQAGEEFLAGQKLGPTLFGGVISGEPTGRSKEYEAGTAIGEAALFALPTLFGKVIPKIKSIPFVKTKETIMPKEELLTPKIQTNTIKAYPASKLRSQGFEESPEITSGFRPKEETNIRKAFEIPEPLVKEQGLVRGASDYGNLREQIENANKPTITAQEKIVKEEPFYQPRIEVRRAQKPGTYQAETKEMFAKDTASTLEQTEVSLGAGTIIKVEQSKGPLGGSIIKEITTQPFKSEYVPLGVGRIKETRINLGEGRTKIITPFGEKTNVNLGKGEPINIPKEKNVEEDVFYKPTLPKTRAKEIGKYRIQTNELIGKTENPLKDIFSKSAEPQVKEGITKPGLKDILSKAELEKEYPQLLGKKAFERSAAHAESVRVEYPFVKTNEIKLGPGIGKRYIISKTPIGFENDLSDLGRGKGFFVSTETGESALKKFNPSRPPPDEGPRNKGQQLLLEKPVEQKGFQSTKVKLGEGKVKMVVVGGGLAAAPAIPLGLSKASGENFTNSTQTNSTQTNQTEIIEQPVSQLEPQQITEQRPASKEAAAVSTRSGIQYGQALRQKRNTTQQILIKPAEKEKEKQFFGLPTPSAQPSRLTQPVGFGQPQRERFKILFPTPSPQTPALKTSSPFAPTQKLKTPQLPKQPKPPAGAPKFVLPKPKEPKKRKGKINPNDFIGNVSEEEITVGFNRGEITTGIERSAKRERKDTLFTRKRAGYTKFVTQTNKQLLSKKQRSVLEREKPKVVKREKRKTGGFF